MKEVLKDTDLYTREEFITELVDLFYRINKENDDCIAFEDITTYLIDHEIAFDAELGTNGGFNPSNSVGMNMDYFESDIKDPTQNIVWVAPQGGEGPNYPNMQSDRPGYYWSSGASA